MLRRPQQWVLATFGVIVAIIFFEFLFFQFGFDIFGSAVGTLYLGVEELAIALMGFALFPTLGILEL